jgi:hypothetical protein
MQDSRERQPTESESTDFQEMTPLATIAMGA